MSLITKTVGVYVLDWYLKGYCLTILLVYYHRIPYLPQLLAYQWRHNGHDCVSNHQPHRCLLNRLFGRRSKKTSKIRVVGLCAGNSSGPVYSPHKGPVTREMFPFDDVIMLDQGSSFTHLDRKLIDLLWGWYLEFCSTWITTIFIAN